MNLKSVGFLLVLALVLATGNAFAHDTGDLMFNVDLQLGYTMPDITARMGGTSIAEINNLDKESYGFNAALYGIVHYYFVGFLALNAGVGFGIDSSFLDYKYKGALYGEKPTFSLTFITLQPIIPVGIRFSAGALALGGGITMSIPVFTRSYHREYSLDSYISLEDKSFQIDPYMGWYFDVGFDLSGRKGQTDGFGMFLRLASSFSDQIGKNSELYSPNPVSYNPFKHYNIALVFQFASELTNAPLF